MKVINRYNHKFQISLIKTLPNCVPTVAPTILPLFVKPFSPFDLSAPLLFINLVLLKVYYPLVVMFLIPVVLVVLIVTFPTVNPLPVILLLISYMQRFALSVNGINV